MNKYDLLLWNFVRDEEDFPDIAVPFLEPDGKSVSATNGHIIITIPLALCGGGGYEVNKKRNFAKITNSAQKCDAKEFNVFDLLDSKDHSDITSWVEGCRIRWQDAVFQFIYIKQIFDVAANFNNGNLLVTAMPGKLQTEHQPLICEIGEISIALMALEIVGESEVGIIDL